MGEDPPFLMSLRDCVAFRRFRTDSMFPGMRTRSLHGRGPSLHDAPTLTAASHRVAMATAPAPLRLAPAW